MFRPNWWFLDLSSMTFLQKRGRCLDYIIMMGLMVLAIG